MELSGTVIQVDEALGSIPHTTKTRKDGRKERRGEERGSSWVWWCPPMTPALKMLRQGCCELEASPGHSNIFSKKEGNIGRVGKGLEVQDRKRLQLRRPEISLSGCYPREQ